MMQSDGVDGDWIYAPPQPVIGFDGGITTKPYRARVFGLPKTHRLEHAAPDSEDHIAFHLWALSFFTGMRLTATEAGFVDATPLQPGKLVDFVLSTRDLEGGTALAERFWVENRAEPQRARLFAAAVHALFLAQYPQHLQFERFMLLYTAFDTCFALAKALKACKRHVTHAARVDCMCKLFGMTAPGWADPAALAALRNDAIHEALFMGLPLGFALHGIGTNQNLTLEMEALICRLLVGLLGATYADYTEPP